MMRGENLRYAKLPHVNLHSFANLSGGETPSRTLAIVLIMTQGKTMRYGGCTYGVAVRNVNTEICPIGALALYLFCLWDVSQMFCCCLRHANVVIHHVSILLILPFLDLPSFMFPYVADKRSAKLRRVRMGGALSSAW